MKFLHTMVRVADIEKSLKFYQDLFDLKITKTMDLEDCRLYFLNDGYSDVTIELTYNFNTPDGGYDNGNSFGHLAFETDCLDKFTEKLQKYSYEYSEPPFMLDNHNLRIAFIDDPDGRAIEIIERK